MASYPDIFPTNQIRARMPRNQGKQPVLPPPPEPEDVLLKAWKSLRSGIVQSSLFIPFGFLGTKHTGIGSANLVAGFVIMEFSAEQARL